MARQPLCSRWVDLEASGAKKIVNNQFALPSTELVTISEPRCTMCNRKFSNVGNLNRHLETSVICKKWIMYNSLQQLQAYIQKPLEPDMPSGNDDTSKLFREWEKSHHRVNLAMLDIYFLDKPHITNAPELKELVQQYNIRYVFAIMPKGATLPNNCGMEYSIMEYDGHDMNMDPKLYDIHIEKIEYYRKNQCKVFILCNAGYQRTIPFLCYYLTKCHPETFGSIEHVLKRVLPQIEKEGHGDIYKQFAIRVAELFKKNEIILKSI